jgi:hypothetical protein
MIAGVPYVGTGSIEGTPGIFHRGKFLLPDRVLSPSVASHAAQSPLDEAHPRVRAARNHQKKNMVQVVF